MKQYIQKDATHALKALKLVHRMNVINNLGKGIIACTICPIIALLTKDPETHLTCIAIINVVLLGIVGVFKEKIFNFPKER